MRKKYLLCGKIGALAFTAVVTSLFYSCAKDGYDDGETFSNGVSNTTLTSPALADSCFSTVVNSDGSESVKVSWKVVYGAGGYECKVYNVDDPANPKEVKADTIDGTSFLFTKTEDTNYNVCVRTLGNTASNNKEAEKSTEFAYSTLVSAQTIPAGSNIVDFVKSNIKDTDSEQAFELEAGADYTIDSELDFGDKLVTFRGNKVNRPTVTLGADGVIRTSKGLKVKFINFDCTNATNNGIIECSSTPGSAPISYKNNAYILEDPIILQECMFKNVPMCLFYTGQCAWGVNDFRIMDCIVQLNNDGSGFSNGAIICTYSGTSTFEGGSSWNSLVRYITIKNSTLYNIVPNSKNRVIRFLSNKPSRVYSTDDGYATITNCTFSKTFTGKEFANNTPNIAQYVITFNDNICYDVFRLQKFIQGNCTAKVDMTTNTIWGVTNSVDATDKAKWATEEDPVFAGDVTQPLDLTKKNGGVDFSASGAISSKIGDPRWLPSAE